MSRRILTYLIMAVSLLPAYAELSAQFIEVKAELDTNQIRIGEVFHLDIQVHQPENVRVDFPAIGDTLVSNIEVLGRISGDTSLNNGALEILRRYRLTSFDSGLYVIPPLKFRFSSDVWSDSLESNPLYLYVHTVPVDSVIYDVKSPLHMPVGFLEVFPFVLGGILAVTGAVFAVWYFRRRKKDKPVFRAPKPEEPAHVIALRELRQLKEERLWQKNEFKMYYTRLTEIIRRYLERRYGIAAMEMTSHEIMEAWLNSVHHPLSNPGNSGEKLDLKLHRLLNLADLVKFARQRPVASDNEENMEAAYDFIEKTKWVKTESEEA